MSRRVRLIAIASAVVVLVGTAAVVAAVLLTKEEKDRPSLTAGEEHGRELFVQSCGRCHTLSATNSVGNVGPDLDAWAPMGIPPGVVESAVRDGRQSVYSNARMPAGLLGGRDAEDVAAFVWRVTARVAERRGGPPPLDWNLPPTAHPVRQAPAPAQTPPRSPHERTTTNAPVEPENP